MKDVMLDLETFGTGYNAAIVQIGACYFDRYTGKIGDKFFVCVDAKSEQAKGFDLDAETVQWWMSQDKKAIDSLFVDIMDSMTAIIKFNAFIRKAAKIWSHSTFDFVIIMNHFKKLHIKPNFGYRDGLDIRTLTNLAAIKRRGFERDGIHHNALDDCVFQVKYCVECFNELKGNNVDVYV